MLSTQDLTIKDGLIHREKARQEQLGLNLQALLKLFKGRATESINKVKTVPISKRRAARTNKSKIVIIPER